MPFRHSCHYSGPELDVGGVSFGLPLRFFGFSFLGLGGVLSIRRSTSSSRADEASSGSVFLGEFAMDDLERKILQLPQVRLVMECVGQVTTAWNHVDSIWYLIGTGLLHELPRDKIDQIYRQFTTGRARREFIMSIANIAFPPKSAFRKEIGRLDALTNDISGSRNAAVHGIYFFDSLNGPPGLRVSPSGDMNKRPNRLAKKGKLIAEELTEIFEQICSLEDELDVFRIILSQEYLPPDKRCRPLSPKQLSSMPPEIQEMLPRHMRERVAPPEFRAKDEK